MARRRIKSMEERFWRKVDRNGPTREGPHYNGLGPCWVFLGSHSIGVERSHLVSQDKRIGVARYSWILHYGPIPDETPIVRHRCDNGHLPCVNPDHLVLGTQADNVEDYYERRTFNGVLTRDSLVAVAIASQTYGVPSTILARIASVGRASLDKALLGVQARDDRPRRRPWNDEEIARAASLAEEGKSMSQIARLLGRSWSGIAHELSRRGIDIKVQGYSAPLSDEEVEDIARRVEAGESIHSVSVQLGKPWGQIKRALARRAATTTES